MNDFQREKYEFSLANKYDYCLDNSELFDIDTYQCILQQFEAMESGFC